MGDFTRIDKVELRGLFVKLLWRLTNCHERIFFGDVALRKEALKLI